MSEKGLKLAQEKMAAAGVPQQAIDVFTYYYRQLEAGVSGFIPEDTIEPLIDPPMLSDVAVASDRATFRVPELLRGIPDATYAAVLPAHVGVAVARDLLTARRFDAAEARSLGVIARVVPHDQLRDAAVRPRTRCCAPRPWPACT